MLAQESVMKWSGRVTTVGMLALIGWIGASIYWTLSTTESARPSAQMETDVGKAQQAIAGRHLFGVYVVAASTPNSTPSDIRLNGAIAAEKPGQRAYALLSIEGKPAQLVREGDELAPGISLKQVQARQVELLRGGQSLILRLPDKAGEANKAAPATTPGSPASAAAALITPPPAPAPIIQAPAITPEPAPAPRRKNRRNSEDDT